MWSHDMVGWCDHRFGEATGSTSTGDDDNETMPDTFGAVPCINFFGDLGQLDAVLGQGLHVSPKQRDGPPAQHGAACIKHAPSPTPDIHICLRRATGFNVYRSFNDCVLLDETMRQGREEAELLSQLLRIRTGHATQGDWQQLLGRLESRQTEAFMQEFYSRS